MPPLLLYAERLFDGERALTAAAVLIDEGRVRWVGRDAALPADARGAAEERLADGQTLLPGFVNCHVHLTLSGAADFAADVAASDEAQSARANGNGRVALAAGVTTVRDLGASSLAPIELGRAVARGTLVGPNVLAAGRTICGVGGHAHEVGREIRGGDDARRAAREQVEAGASAVKVIATGGVLGAGGAPDVAELTLEEIRGAVEIAHAHGLRVTAHAHATAGITCAIEAGVDSIEHATGLDAECIRLCRERGVAIVPTFTALKRILANRDKLSAEVVSRSVALVERHQQGVRDAVRAGVVVATGTDAGTPFNYPDHFALELEALVEIGLGAEQVLRSATSVSADVIGRSDLGRVRAGARADLVAVRGDPLADVRACWDVAAVWKDGRRVEASAAPRRA